MADITADDYDYNRDRQIVTAPDEFDPDENNPWAGIERAVALHIWHSASHPPNGDVRLAELTVDPDHPLCMLPKYPSVNILGEIRTCLVRDANANRGRFNFRREQHERLLDRSEHLDENQQDRYIFAVYEPLTQQSWRIVDLATMTAPEVHDLRETWTWTDRRRYQIASISWSKIPDLDPVAIESEYRGYWSELREETEG
ncbi:hypothetical protein DVK00_02790 [Haloarcula sp. Atlit-47R]|uniref:hypothetical protein n=1 Tax=Haloarcula sp. Atlit-47R TaxID=2282132 RepID=UPI000EF2863A|nr:hypothetical protein [Haloarcula sp. Atlit-47R]RLM47451.1 hypothetical protein DVK00_02790 [Haloarcula sp. Atlit-47R]